MGTRAPQGAQPTEDDDRGTKVDRVINLNKDKGNVPTTAGVIGDSTSCALPDILKPWDY